MELIRKSILLTVALGPSIACAVPITYTFTGTASGTIGGTSFSNATLTITVTLDTSNVINISSGNFRNLYAANTATFSISGVGSGTFNNSGSVSASQVVFGGTLALFDDGDGPLIDIIDSLVGSTALTSYSLTTPIGPLGPQASNLVGPFTVPTSRGSLTVPIETNVTFQAAVVASAVTPIPPSFYLCLVGLGGLGFYTALQRGTKKARLRA